ncbi:MAG: bile acid:sodium symporter [Methanocellales archaeon]|nr:bile acid:sodium symporter [Methanocellales archaeon]
MKRILKSSSFVFVFAAALALAYPGLAGLLEPCLIPAIIVLMTFSLIEIELRKLDVRRDLKSILTALGLNYIFLSGLILVGAVFLLKDVSLWRGFIVMIATPPAVGIIALSTLLKGDTKFALVANTSIYVLSILLMPAILLLFLGSAINPLTILKILLELIGLPLVLSRVIGLIPRYEQLKEDKDILINLGFFVVIYVIIGLNHDVLLSEYGLLIPVSIIGIIRTFFAGTLVFGLGRALNIPLDRNIAYALFGSYKNLGLTATIALLLFGARATIPSAVCILFEVLMFPYLSMLTKHQRLTLS